MCNCMADTYTRRGTGNVEYGRSVAAGENFPREESIVSVTNLRGETFLFRRVGGSILHAIDRERNEPLLRVLIHREETGRSFGRYSRGYGARICTQ